jgi:hypothetical protein
MGLENFISQTKKTAMIKGNSILDLRFLINV